MRPLDALSMEEDSVCKPMLPLEPRLATEATEATEAAKKSTKATTVKKNADNKKDDKITTDKKRTQERTRLVTNISGGYPRVRRPWAPRARGG